jgi:DNA-binding NarL/FixJ family response regulator
MRQGRDFPTQINPLALHTNRAPLPDNGVMSKHHPVSTPRQPVRRLLVVESCAPLRRALCRWLQTAIPEHQSQGATSAEEALVLALYQPPAIIVMDIRLHGIDGIDATRYIKRLVPSCDVVLFTHYDSAIYRERALAAGAAALILKRRAEHDLLPQLQQLITPSHYN